MEWLTVVAVGFTLPFVVMGIVKLLLKFDN